MCKIPRVAESIPPQSSSSSISVPSPGRGATLCDHGVHHGDRNQSGVPDVVFTICSTWRGQAGTTILQVRKASIARERRRRRKKNMHRVAEVFAGILAPLFRWLAMDLYSVMSEKHRREANTRPFHAPTSILPLSASWAPCVCALVEL
jgi:hypothetical protein